MADAAKGRPTDDDDAVLDRRTPIVGLRAAEAALARSREREAGLDYQQIERVRRRSQRPPDRDAG